jgi:hypothetical protein
VAIVRANDPTGRVVELTEAGWAHIIERRPEIEGYRERLLETVARPDRWVLTATEGEEWFYSAGTGPSHWLKVVVRFEEQKGLIVTAFARRAFP